jgi:hypothetical protein
LNAQTQRRWRRSLSVAIGAISGLGLYETICRLVEFLLGKWEWVKCAVLGRNFVEGKWYGFYTYTYEESGQTHVVVHLLIENITQEWEKIRTASGLPSQRARLETNPNLRFALSRIFRAVTLTLHVLCN